MPEKPGPRSLTSRSARLARPRLRRALAHPRDRAVCRRLRGRGRARGDARRDLRRLRRPRGRPAAPASAHNEWLLELFHGPTLAFKDFALQLLGRLFDAVLSARGERITIVGATSGDTGSAAIAACRDRAALDIFILHPARPRVRRPAPADDDGARRQRPQHRDRGHVRRLPGPREGAVQRRRTFRAEMHLSAVNSINWARIVAQIAYYVWAALQARRAGGGPSPSPCRPAISATSMPATPPVRWACRSDKLIVGSNRNDILTRFLETGAMTMRAVEPSLSPEHGHPGFEQLRAAAVRSATAAMASVLPRRHVRDFREKGRFELDAGRDGMRCARSSTGARLDRSRDDRGDPNALHDGDPPSDRSPFGRRHHGRPGAPARGRVTPLVSHWRRRTRRSFPRRSRPRPGCARTLPGPSLRSFRARGKNDRPARRSRRRARTTSRRSASAVRIGDNSARARRSRAHERRRRNDARPTACASSPTRMAHVETVSLGVWVRAGTRDETADVNGIAHLLEHMAFKGTARRSARAIAEEIEAVGGHSERLHQPREHRLLRPRAQGRRRARARYPDGYPASFDLRSATSWRASARSCCRRSARRTTRPTTSSSITSRKPRIPDQPMGWPTLGKPGDRRQAGPGRAHRLHGTKPTAPSILWSTAAGRIEHEPFVRLVEDQLGAVPSVRTTGPDDVGALCRRRVSRGPRPRADPPGPGFARPSRASTTTIYALGLFSTMLGGGMSSRLFQEIREKRGLVYSIYSFHSGYRDSGRLRHLCRHRPVEACRADRRHRRRVRRDSPPTPGPTSCRAPRPRPRPRS